MHEVRLTRACFEQSQVEAVFASEADLHKAECELQQQDVDLQSAVARLAAIRSAVQGRDLRHLRLQDLQVGLDGVHRCITGNCSAPLFLLQLDVPLDRKVILRIYMFSMYYETNYMKF